MTYYGYYPPPPPAEANRREKKARYVALGYVGLVVLVVVGVAVYVMLQRLENVLHRAIHLLLLLLFIFAKLNTRTEGENGDSVR